MKHLISLDLNLNQLCTVIQVTILLDGSRKIFKITMQGKFALVFRSYVGLLFGYESYTGAMYMKLSKHIQCPTSYMEKSAVPKAHFPQKVQVPK